MKFVQVTASTGDVLSATVFKDGTAALVFVNEPGAPLLQIHVPREEAVKALRDLADQIEKAVP